MKLLPILHLLKIKHYSCIGRTLDYFGDSSCKIAFIFEEKKMMVISEIFWKIGAGLYYIANELGWFNILYPYEVPPKKFIL